MGFTYITPVLKNPSAAQAWVDVDVSAEIPAGATGAILHCENPDGLANIAFRKNGSTFDPVTKPEWRGTSHGWMIVPVDASRIFEVWSDFTTFKMYVIGHTDDKVKFFDPPLQKDVAASVWTDVDLSADVGADAGNVLMAFGLINDTGGLSQHNVRPNGSTDDRTAGSMGIPWFVKVDAGDIFEQWTNSATEGIYVYGYAIADVDMPNLNAIDRSSGFALNTWTDMAALPTGSVGGMYEIRDTGKDNNYGLRKNGSTENILSGSSARLAYGLPECDAGLICEGQIAATSQTIFEWGGVKAPTGGGGGGGGNGGGTMALLGSFIDSRTVASFASNASASFAHGLPGVPDFVLVQGVGNATTAGGIIPLVSADATNVSLFASGSQSSPLVNVVSVVAHSIIR